MPRSLALLCVLLLPFSAPRAQLRERLTVEPTRVDTAMNHVLGLRLHTLAFFHDNEFSNVLTTGYTLPGVRLTPALTYNPHPQIHLELGATALIYDGANRYPNYAYHDIATWKGHQYIHGAHVLPWVRAQMDFKHLSIVLGDLYGGCNHGLIEPMYNPETDLSQDPEMGFQLLLHRRHIDLDTWMNWQSYIYKEDTHQEAFTVGTTARLRWDVRPHLRLYAPLQLLVQHRGGEQDTTSLGVQTLCNGSAGFGVDYHPARRVLTRLYGELNAIGALQENGDLWPFDTGFALHAEAGATLLRDLSLTLGYVGAPRQFIPLYGTPIFSTVSIRPDRYHQQFSSNHTAYLRADYARTIARDYTVGAQFQLYQGLATGLKHTSFSFGVYLKLDPTIVLKRFK